MAETFHSKNAALGTTTDTVVLQILKLNKLEHFEWGKIQKCGRWRTIVVKCHKQMV